MIVKSVSWSSEIGFPVHGHWMLERETLGYGRRCILPNLVSLHFQLSEITSSPDLEMDAKNWDR